MARALMRPRRQEAGARRSRLGRSRDRRGYPLVAALFAASALAACGPAAPPIRDVFFSLEPEVTVPPSPRSVSATLQVGQLAARGFLGGSEIVFRTAGEPLQTHRHHDLLWEEPPARAVSQNLADALREAGIFAFVVTLADRSRADWLLQGELTRFEHRPTDQPPKVTAAFNLTLVRNSDRTSRFSKTYAGDEPTAGTGPEAMARAFNRLTARLIEQVVRDIQALAPRLEVAESGTTTEQAR
jgi:cholesterol transport system auxiliary component